MLEFVTQEGIKEVVWWLRTFVLDLSNVVNFLYMYYHSPIIRGGTIEVKRHFQQVVLEYWSVIEGTTKS